MFYRLIQIYQQYPKHWKVLNRFLLRFSNVSAEITKLTEQLGAQQTQDLWTSLFSTGVTAVQTAHEVYKYEDSRKKGKYDATQVNVEQSESSNRNCGADGETLGYGEGSDAECLGSAFGDHPAGSDGGAGQPNGGDGYDLAIDKSDARQV